MPSLHTLRSYLLRAAGQGTFAHGYLLVGGSRAERAGLAREFSATLLGTPVDRLHAHPDFLFIGPPTESTATGRSKDIPVDDVREAINRLSLSSSTGHKVAVIDEAQQLSLSGENALLKTLEEPSGSACLILCADQESALLPTVRSRLVPLRLDAHAFAIDSELESELNEWLSKSTEEKVAGIQVWLKEKKGKGSAGPTRDERLVALIGLIERRALEGQPTYAQVLPASLAAFEAWQRNGNPNLVFETIAYAFATIGET